MVGGQVRKLEVEGGPLNQGHMRGNGKVQVAVVKGRPWGGKALVAERHSKVTVKELKLRRQSGLVTGCRPAVLGTQSEELGKPMWSWQEQTLPQGCGRAGGLQWLLLCAPHEGDLDTNTDKSCPCPGVCPGGCRRQRHGLQPGAEGQALPLLSKALLGPVPLLSLTPQGYSRTLSQFLLPQYPGQSQLACSSRVTSQVWEGGVPRRKGEDS